MTRRISRAKQRIKDSGVPFAMPPGPDTRRRLDARPARAVPDLHRGLRQHLGPELHRADLPREAIRLARLLHRLLPDDSEVAGLLALMLLTDARRPARTGADGELIPMAEQDRTLWDAAPSPRAWR